MPNSPSYSAEYRLPSAYRTIRGQQQPYPARKKGGQRPQDQPQVLTCTAQHRMDRIANAAFEPVALEQSVGLHVTDQCLDEATTPQELASLTPMHGIAGLRGWPS